VGRGERAGVRARLPQGVHLPHPDITQTRGRHVEVRADRGPVPLEVDGVAVPPAALVTVDVVPGAFVLVL
jgi:diacylglycerol kinase family enzyme